MVFLTARAEKQLKKIPLPVRRQIVLHLDNLNKKIVVPIPLTGSWKGWHKVRVGSYRVLLTKSNDSEWIVGFIRHRKDVYRA